MCMHVPRMHVHVLTVRAAVPQGGLTLVQAREFLREAHGRFAEWGLVEELKAWLSQNKALGVLGQGCGAPSARLSAPKGKGAMRVPSLEEIDEAVLGSGADST